MIYLYWPDPISIRYEQSIEDYYDQLASYVPPNMFTPNQPYDPDNDLPPADIREDFSGLTYEYGYEPQSILDRLASFLPTDKLAEFMDDLAMGRI